MSWPLGAGNRGFQLPKFSLRLGQARMGGNTGNPLAVGDPMRHREFLRLEVSGRRDMPALDTHALDLRVRFAGRLTYDLNHGVFGSHADSRVFQMHARNSASAAVSRTGRPALIK